VEGGRVRHREIRALRDRQCTAVREVGRMLGADRRGARAIAVAARSVGIPVREVSAAPGWSDSSVGGRMRRASGEPDPLVAAAEAALLVMLRDTENRPLPGVRS